jgi:hypothetical protein
MRTEKRPEPNLSSGQLSGIALSVAGEDGSSIATQERRLQISTFPPKQDIPYLHA